MNDEQKVRPPVAYLNKQFLASNEGRSIRILSEYLEPLGHLRRQRIRDTVVFFGSARIKADGPLAHYYNDARELSGLITSWAKEFRVRSHRFVVCTGGGPGIMEAANRGADDVQGKTIGLNIGLPFEQFPNPYISPELNFEFHYFFMRKFWFAYLAKALVVFPGGFGTMDELFEILTLVQTKKLEKKIDIILYGKGYWQEVINFEAFVKYGMVSREDLSLFKFADTPSEAFELLRNALSPEAAAAAATARDAEVPAIAPTTKSPQ